MKKHMKKAKAANLRGKASAGAGELPGGAFGPDGEQWGHRACCKHKRVPDVNAPEGTHVRPRERAELDLRLPAIDVSLLLPVSLGPDHRSDATHTRVAWVKGG